MSDKSLEEKLIDKFGEKEAGKYYDIQSRVQFVEAFSILDSVKESVEGITIALISGSFDRAAAKEGITPLKYAELAIKKTEEVSEEKATVIYSTMRKMIAAHNQYSVDDEDHIIHRGPAPDIDAAETSAPPSGRPRPGTEGPAGSPGTRPGGRGSDPSRPS